ncbi:receptor-like serine/threonine kinase, partial [Trifolium pratense]
MVNTRNASSSGLSEPSLDASSPYFIHPSDGTNSVSVKPLLTGSNYHSWARSMRRALGGKTKFEFVDGTFSVVTDQFDSSYRAWIQSLNPSITCVDGKRCRYPLGGIRNIHAYSTMHMSISVFLRSYAANSSAPTKKHCTFCDKPNHTVADCFKKHGYPPHMQRNHGAYNASTEGGEASNTAEAPPAQPAPSPSITQDQFDQLMQILQSSNINQSSGSTSSHQ